MPPFAVRVIGPEQVFFEGEAESVSLRTVLGEATFLPGHAPLVAALEACTVRVLRASGEDAFELEGGFVEVGPKGVTVVAVPAGDEASGSGAQGSA
jgi:F-type H+-transporting ATPase subunit epsilon